MLYSKLFLTGPNVPDTQQLEQLVKIIDGPRLNVQNTNIKANMSSQKVMCETSNSGGRSNIDNPSTNENPHSAIADTRPLSPLTDSENDPQPPKKKRRSKSPSKSRSKSRSKGRSKGRATASSGRLTRSAKRNA